MNGNFVQIIPFLSSLTILPQITQEKMGVAVRSTQLIWALPQDAKWISLAAAT